MVEYYYKVSTTEYGDYYNIQYMVEVAHIFNHLIFSGHTDAEVVANLHLLVDKLNYFDYSHFTDQLIA